MWVLLLLWPLVRGLSPEDVTLTPAAYYEVESMGGGDDGIIGPRPRSFPGQPSANDSNTLELLVSSRALLLGWVPTRLGPALYGLALAVGLPANGRTGPGGGAARQWPGTVGAGHSGATTALHGAADELGGR
ncbi:hypothetical protein CB1_000172024 [Camelus ferus]|nr:hypothetical protein CB1_000172024 [Camelus ferus]